MSNLDAAALDDPVGESLRGRHAHLARLLGRAVTYQPDVASFSSVTEGPHAEEWTDLAKRLGRETFADMFSGTATPPPDWAPVFVLEGRQLVLSGRAEPRAETGVVDLGAEDVPEMLDLVARTKPGGRQARVVRDRSGVTSADGIPGRPARRSARAGRGSTTDHRGAGHWSRSGAPTRCRWRSAWT